MVILFYNNILLTSILLAITSIISLVKWNSRITFVVFIFGALWGAFSEMLAIYYGVWNYAVTNFFNIPFWLFIIWGNAAAFLYQTGKEFGRLGIKN